MLEKELPQTNGNFVESVFDAFRMGGSSRLAAMLDGAVSNS